MKKILCVLLALLLTSGMLAACSNGSGPAGNTSSGKLKIVTTIFPIYDWVKNILGEKAETAELTMLLDSGVDLHSFQPTASDILSGKISVRPFKDKRGLACSRCGYKSICRRDREYVKNSAREIPPEPKGSK